MDCRYPCAALTKRQYYGTMVSVIAEGILPTNLYRIAVDLKNSKM